MHCHPCSDGGGKPGKFLTSVLLHLFLQLKKKRSVPASSQNWAENLGYANSKHYLNTRVEKQPGAIMKDQALFSRGRRWRKHTEEPQAMANLKPFSHSHLLSKQRFFGGNKCLCFFFFWVQIKLAASQVISYPHPGTHDWPLILYHEFGVTLHCPQSSEWTTWGVYMSTLPSLCTWVEGTDQRTYSMWERLLTHCSLASLIGGKVQARQWHSMTKGICFLCPSKVASPSHNGNLLWLWPGGLSVVVIFLFFTISIQEDAVMLWLGE